MSTNKRRKLNVAEPPPAMSAFALRKKLLADRAAAAAAAVANPQISQTDEVDATNIEQLTKASSPRKPRKNRDGQKVPVHENSPKPNLNEAQPMDSVAEAKSIRDQPDTSMRSPSPTSTDDEALLEIPAVHFSSFRPTKSNCQRRKGGNLQMKLSDGERLVILGSYGIRVALGEITINGATLRPSRIVHWVYAPHCHALPVIRCSETATLELCSHSGAEGLRKLGQLSPHFRKIWNEASHSSDGQSDASVSTYQILYTSADGPKRALLQDLVSPPEWNKEMAKLLEAPTSRPISIMITGPKSSGKSTFGKVLANRFITNGSVGARGRASGGVAILDLDPGQPEFCTVGHISLALLSGPVLGPSFCHPLPATGVNVIRSHVLASISPASDPELYVEAAMDLMTHYRNVLGKYPLIINTPGWIQGTGLDLLTSLISRLRPTEVIYMSQSGPAEAVESLQEACKVTGFSPLPSQSTQYTTRTAAHLRSMQAMSYFHAGLRSQGGDGHQLQWDPKPLTGCPPWQVSYKGANRGIFGVMFYDYQVPPELLADTINGTILAAVEVESAKAFRELATTNTADSAMGIDSTQANQPSPLGLSRLQGKVTTPTPEGISFIHTTNGTTLDPRYSRSLGLVLVRGIDVQNGVLQILTPITAERIEEVASKGGEIVLVGGKFDSPSWAYTEDLYYQSREERGSVEVDESTQAAEDDMNDAPSEDDDAGTATAATPTPWVEVLQGNPKRLAGSKVWRVRRDLGRT